MSTSKITTKKDYLLAIDSSIEMLKNIKDKITESNFSKFEINTRSTRPVEPEYLSSFSPPIGFKKAGPSTLEICIKDYTDIGSLVGGSNEK